MSSRPERMKTRTWRLFVQMRPKRLSYSRRACSLSWLRYHLESLKELAMDLIQRLRS